MNYVIEMAKRAGAHRMKRIHTTDPEGYTLIGNEELERFAALIAKDCAKVCESSKTSLKRSVLERGYNLGLEEAAAAIRSKYCEELT